MAPLFACFPVCLTFVAIGIVGMLVVALGMYNRTPLEDRPEPEPVDVRRVEAHLNWLLRAVVGES